jgi:hypothetical protein
MMVKIRDTATTEGAYESLRAMPLFKCSKCGCVENTALCHYWSARLRQSPALCSACDPKIDKWHGEFPQESAQGWVIDERGFLWNAGDVECWLRQSLEMVRKVP